MPSKIFNSDAWTALAVGSKFTVFTLSLGQNEFTVAPTSVPFQCRFPAPNDGLGVNTFRGNAFVKGRFQILPHASTAVIRARGDEVVAARWATEGGAEFLGMDEHNEFWCVNLRDPNDGIYLQACYPLEPGQSVTIPNRTLERNVFILEGEVDIEGSLMRGFKHVRLTKDQPYQITNVSGEPAFVLYFYQATIPEFIAAGEPTLPEASYRKIPILQDAYWGAENEPI